MLFLTEVIAQFLFFFDMYYFASGFLQGEDARIGVAFLMVLLCTVGCICFKKKAVNMTGFVVCHIVLAAVMYISFALSVSNWLLLGMLWIEIAYFVTMRFMKEKLSLINAGYGQAALMGACYLLDKFAYEKSTTIHLWFLFFLFMDVYLFYRNRKAAERYIEIRQRRTIMDAEPMKKASNMIAGTYALITGILMLAASTLFLNVTMPHFHEISLPEWKHEIEETEETESADDPYKAGGGYLGDRQLAGLSHVLEAIYPVFAIILFLVFFLTIIYNLIKYMKQAFQQNEEEGEQTVFINPFDKTEKIKKKPILQKPYIAQDNREKVRYLYKKKMNGFWKKQKVRPEKTTPQMQVQLMSEQGKHASKDMLMVYEKARYSQEIITSKDVQNMEKK